MKLQKLVYHAQAWHLALLDNELITDDFQAWVHNPVIPRLYDDYKHIGWKPLLRDDLTSEAFCKLKSTNHPEVQRVLDDVEYEYFGLSAFELEKLTHHEEPWLLTRDGHCNTNPSLLH